MDEHEVILHIDRDVVSRNLNLMVECFCGFRIVQPANPKIEGRVDQVLASLTDGVDRHLVEVGVMSATTEEFWMHDA